MKTKRKIAIKDSKKGIIQLIKLRYMGEGVDEQEISKFIDLSRELSLMPGVHSFNISADKNITNLPPELSMTIVFESEEAMDYFHSHPKKKSAVMMTEEVSQERFPFSYVDYRTEDLL